MIPALDAILGNRTAASVLLFIENYDAGYAPNPIKQWLGYLRHYYPQAALLFEEIKRLRDPALLRERLTGAMKAAPTERRSAA